MGGSKLYQTKTGLQRIAGSAASYARLMASMLLVVSVLCSIGIFATEFVCWLRTAKWKTITLGDGILFLHWKEPDSSWLGVRIILAWALNLPLALCLPLLAFAIGAIIARAVKVTLGKT